MGQAGQLFPRFPPLLPALALSAVALGSDNFSCKTKTFFKGNKQIHASTRGFVGLGFFLLVFFSPPLKYTNLLFYFATKVSGGKNTKNKNQPKPKTPARVSVRSSNTAQPAILFTPKLSFLPSRSPRVNFSFKPSPKCAIPP